ncbi:reverse transcriptase [Cucumis melo var. makuwa]|uniref:Reverse transcriptase n=1 Tax=Cucumis melo var. makuwa TaxID=1194695 RepID=A0A5D3BGP2_CUCMM|nr:reverse transcriptase [Cucumis melo var. makuwa]TYJ97645.1 reverse transcriptase [Cucumis melo var. makuwa]
METKQRRQPSVLASSSPSPSRRVQKPRTMQRLLSKVRDFYHTIEMQFNANIAILQSDNGCEFQLNTLNEILSSKVIANKVPLLHLPTKWGKWRTAVMEEMRALEKNKTWELYALPKRHKTWDANECLPSSTNQMVLLTNIRLGSIVDRKSTFRYVFLCEEISLLGEVRSKMLSGAVLKPDNMAMSLGICEEIWLQKVIRSSSSL